MMIGTRRKGNLVWTSEAYPLGRDSFVLGWRGLDFYKKIDKIRPLAAGQRRHCCRQSPPYSSPCPLRCLLRRLDFSPSAYSLHRLTFSVAFSVGLFSPPLCLLRRFAVLPSLSPSQLYTVPKTNFLVFPSIKKSYLNLIPKINTARLGLTKYLMRADRAYSCMKRDTGIR